MVGDRNTRKATTMRVSQQRMLDYMLGPFSTAIGNHLWVQ